MQKQVVIGIDIGGTNTIIGLITATGECLVQESIRTWDYPRIEAFIERVHAVAYVRCAARDTSPAGVGIGVPTGNTGTGTFHASNLPWKGVVPIAALFREYFQLPVFVTNDAKAAVLGEMTYGAAKGMKNVVVITLGTGLGSGIAVNGELVHGHDGLAGELGHVIVVPGGRACKCGRRGCLETYVSATGIKRTVSELLAGEVSDSVLREIPYASLGSKMIDDAAAKVDLIALEAFRRAGQALGLALANLVTITRPETIFLQGGVAKAGPWFYDAVNHSLDENLLFLYKGMYPVRRSLLPDGAITGASALAWRALLVE